MYVGLFLASEANAILVQSIVDIMCALGDEDNGDSWLAMGGGDIPMLSGVKCDSAVMNCS